MTIPTGAFTSERLSAHSAFMGSVIWAGLIILPANHVLLIGIIEKLFLLGPLVIVPVGMRLLAILEPTTPQRVFKTIVLSQPLAALLVVCSFLMVPGALPGLLVVPWFLVCAGLTLVGFSVAWTDRVFDIPRMAFLAATIYLPVGAGGLAFSRLGVNLMDFGEPTILLTAVHFTFTGFATPLIIASVGKEFSLGRLWERTYNATAVGMVIAMPLIATGFIFLPLLKIVGISILVVSLHMLALIFFRLLPSIPRLLPKVLLLVSGISLFCGMILAGVYGLGEFVGKLWISIPQMAKTHGVINAVGFTLCGIVGWLSILSKEDSQQ